jgi:HCOMODA/2-hydroxy-3-carboxy-muconic semialdehyde decarboxylase
MLYPQTMGLQYSVLMRGHGYAAGGDSIKKAVSRQSMQFKMPASNLRQSRWVRCNTLTPGEAAISQETIEKTIGRPWQLWTERVKKSQP